MLLNPFSITDAMRATRASISRSCAMEVPEPLGGRSSVGVHTMDKFCEVILLTSDLLMISPSRAKIRVRHSRWTGGVCWTRIWMASSAAAVVRATSTSWA